MKCIVFAVPDVPCMHCRLVREWNNATGVNMVLRADFSSVYRVSKTNSIDKYSVIENGGGYFVHVCREPKGITIECQSGFCKWKSNKFKQKCTHCCAVENAIRCMGNKDENEDVKINKGVGSYTKQI